MKNLRVGVIGLGIGRGHVREFHRLPDVTVAALADPDAGRLESAGQEFAVNALYADGFEMIRQEGLDIVAVATPNAFHRDYTIAALRAGSHVLCEKPMALNARESAQMLAAARRAGKRIMINFSFRFSPQALALKKEVDAGALGEVYFGRTVWLRRRGVPGLGGWFSRKALSGGGPAPLWNVSFARTPVPEPATAGVLLIAWCSLCVIRRTHKGFD